MPEKGQSPYLGEWGGNQKSSLMYLHRVKDLKGNWDTGWKKEQAQPLTSSEALGNFLNLPMINFLIFMMTILRGPT